MNAAMPCRRKSAHLISTLLAVAGALTSITVLAQDNAGHTWKAYQTRYWPTLYLVDKHGDLRYRHIGEGNYAEIEAAIQALLAEPGP